LYAPPCASWNRKEKEKKERNSDLLLSIFIFFMSGAAFGSSRSGMKEKKGGKGKERPFLPCFFSSITTFCAPANKRKKRKRGEKKGCPLVVFLLSSFSCCHQRKKEKVFFRYWQARIYLSPEPGLA